MPDRTLPDFPSLEQYKKQARELLRAAAAGQPDELARVRKHHPRLRNLTAEQSAALRLADAQLVLAREHGYASWPEFARRIDTLRILRSVEELADPLNTFIDLACVDRHGWHGSGTLEYAEIILARSPAVAAGSIYSAAVLGDEAGVRAWLQRDPSLATATGGPHNWDALTYLCFSRYLRLDRARGEGFVASARVLLEAGASANTGWTEYIDDPPRPVPETAIYGAAGLAQHAALTQLLLEHGADPNDEETPYHVPETYDNTVLRILLGSGRWNETSLATVIARKADWHDEDGLKLALEHGANPNYQTRWKVTPFQHAIRRDNGLPMIEAFLDHGADPLLPNNLDGRNAAQMAAYHGRGDILAALERRGYAPAFAALDALVAACARGDEPAARALAAQQPQRLQELKAHGGALLGRFAGVGNADGVRCLLALGIGAAEPWRKGDGYWELAPNSTALHAAAWRARHDVVRLLISAGAPVNARDARNRSPLQLAVRACIDSYWKQHRQPDSVAALLAAGASAAEIPLPTGYDAIDALLDANH